MWTLQMFYSHAGGRTRDTVILIDRNIHFESPDIIYDSNGRFIIVSGKLGNKLITLATVYAPNTDDATF